MKIEEYIHNNASLELIRKAEQFAKNFFEREGTHGFSHIKRVFNLCLHLGKDEGADLEVLALAALLHDIARPLEDKGIVDDHAKESAKIARRFLGSLGYPKIEEVVHAIEAHRFSKPPEPKTIEAKILSDADKLDAIGAIGVARVFMYSGEHGRDIEFSLKHFEEKILKLKDLMYTKSAKKLANERHKFVEEFIKRIQKEIEGEL
ncbi:HD domain-containing protein [Thermococcus argininiproducens]|uniref:HD domain-containing protein n=1 Tax=Thermococcus argininiproducens TaxID=2866384 RepID=A0A9E7M926_9EURY|nr:HD domain-containing protein [Thermococcus argininiproducens]USG98971.1 HD domain-containing protein [Thermococcus argininiproducens]